MKIENLAEMRMSDSWREFRTENFENNWLSLFSHVCTSIDAELRDASIGVQCLHLLLRIFLIISKTRFDWQRIESGSIQKCCQNYFAFFIPLFTSICKRNIILVTFVKKKEKKKPATSLLTTGIPKNVVSYVRIFVFS